MQGVRSKFARPMLFWTLISKFVFFSSPEAFSAPASIEPQQPQGQYSALGPWSLSAGFPQGGSVWGSPALGIRHELIDGGFASAAINFSTDRTGKSESFGVFAKWNQMLSAGWGKSFPYAFLQSGMLTEKLSEKSKRETSTIFAAGLGVEVSLLREISTSLETGFGGVLLPATQTSFTTATTQLSVHYHFEF
ncbi:MAG: hypothetical protein RLZZ488_2289 [Pseudomonadota bacterium]